MERIVRTADNWWQCSRAPWKTALVTVLTAIALSTLGNVGVSEAKTLSGELQCAPGEKVTGIWLLGSRSGWHGFDYPRSKLPYTGWYSISNAVQGETIKAWLRCAVFGESYSSFTVGSGSTRHICSKGWICLSTNIGACGVQVAFSGLSMRLIGCLIRYGR